MEDRRKTLRLRDSDLVWREVDGEVIVLHKGSWAYLSVNGSGAALWERLAAGATADELAQLLISRFGIDGGRAAGDVERFVSELDRYGLVER